MLSIAPAAMTVNFGRIVSEHPFWLRAIAVSIRPKPFITKFVTVALSQISGPFSATNWSCNSVATLRSLNTGHLYSRGRKAGTQPFGKK